MIHGTTTPGFMIHGLWDTAMHSPGMDTVAVLGSISFMPAFPVTTPIRFDTILLVGFTVLDAGSGVYQPTQTRCMFLVREVVAQPLQGAGAVAEAGVAHLAEPVALLIIMEIHGLRYPVLEHVHAPQPKLPEVAQRVAPTMEDLRFEIIMAVQIAAAAPGRAVDVAAAEVV